MRLLALLLVSSMAAGGCLNGFVDGAGRVEAMDIVSSKDYQRWVIEVDYAQGHRPDQSLLDFLHGRLAPVVDKPNGVAFELGDTLGDSDRVWGAEALVDYAKQHRDTETGGDTVVLHMLFVLGHHEADNGDARVLGVAIDHDLIAIFVESMDQLCQQPILPIPTGCTTAPYYRSVVLHELGHAMGLVDNGLPMVRDHEAATCGDRPDEGHSDNPDSVMTCAVEQSVQLLGFGANPPNAFDQDDLADLQAARNG